MPPKRRIRRRPEFPCGSCRKECQPSQASIYCEDCRKWYHPTCQGITDDEFLIWQDNNSCGHFICQTCRKNEDGGFDFSSGMQRLAKAAKTSLKALRKTAMAERLMLGDPTADWTPMERVRGPRDSISEFLLGFCPGQDRTPVWTVGDGNCLFNAAVLLFWSPSNWTFQEFDLAMELRYRTCLVMSIDDTAIRDDPRACEIRPVSPDYSSSLIDCATPGGFSSAWTIIALSRVLRRPIAVSYPQVNGQRDKCAKALGNVFGAGDFNDQRQPLHILWTSTTMPQRGKTWCPNHFVALAPLSSAPSHSHGSASGQPQMTSSPPPPKAASQKPTVRPSSKTSGQPLTTSSPPPPKAASQKLLMQSRQHNFSAKTQRGENDGNPTRVRRKLSLKRKKSVVHSSTPTDASYINATSTDAECTAQVLSEEHSNAAVDSDYPDVTPAKSSDSPNLSKMPTQSTPLQHRGCDMTDANLASQSSDYFNSEDTSPSLPSHSNPNSCGFDSSVSTVPNDSFTSVSLLDNTEVHADRKKQCTFAEGGSRGTGKFLDGEELIPLLTSSDTPLREIPRGKKDNMIFRISNSVNTVRVAKGKTSIFVDDCGAWTGYISSKTVHYLVDGGSLRYMEHSKGQYVTIVKKERIPMDPQPEEGKILVLRRTYTTLKADSSFKRRITSVLKYPDSMTPVHDVFVVEYCGSQPGRIGATCKMHKDGRTLH